VSIVPRFKTVESRLHSIQILSLGFDEGILLRRRDVLEFQNRPDQSLLEFCPLAGSLDPIVCCAHVSSLFGFDVKQSSGSDCLEPSFGQP
jgi:hypothetical protein